MHSMAVGAQSKFQGLGTHLCSDVSEAFYQSQIERIRGLATVLGDSRLQIRVESIHGCNLVSSS